VVPVDEDAWAAATVEVEAEDVASRSIPAEYWYGVELELSLKVELFEL